MSGSASQRRDFVVGTVPTTVSVPDDLKVRGVRRVEIFAWLVLVVDLVGTLIDHIGFAMTESAWPDRNHIFDLVGSTAIAVICVVMIIAARSRLSLERRIAVGIGFFILLAVGIAVTDFGDAFWTHDGGAGHALHGIPAHVSVMLVTPVILPLSAWRTFVVAVIMSAAGPFAMVVDAWILKLPIAEAQPLVQSSAFILIPVATALGHIVHRLGLDVKRARAMGSYTLEYKLGEGGMGEVWRARHRFLARPAAVKLIRGGLAEGSGRQRFEREAQATAALKSPHTVEVYEYGVSQNGDIYYVMELLEGFDLEKLVSRCGPQPPARVVAWLRQACHSLAEAHEVGIVHRDIKPANLIVCRYGRDLDFLKVLDFGLATLAPSINTNGQALTGENTVVGTPAYMPPELATGKSPVDARSDLYALGCVAYFAVTGRRPFEADSAVEVILGHVDKKPVPPSQVLGYEIPPSLENAILACMAKQPEERPQSAQELADLLTGVTEWPADEARRWWNEVGATLEPYEESS